ncbi:hypothetical protein F8388_011720 [Cannabis sativa]|uniref:Reverse transcriptase zinc-binding domain-containing protein n=1 Tax=Cannabis sativa TaxID=3483 RepID=A0A7J6E2T2_CANSA|nr:hypothetical protein G4B88_015040 [Cannabis sativa]KAF4387572.1 hypothetical protein F8388_011720 [Cannabis sativa]
MNILVKKVMARIEGWKYRLLSKAGRACLIQTEDVKHILNIGLPTHSQNDSWLWLGEESGNFSLKLAYRLVRNRSFASQSNWIWKDLWNSPLHSRLKLLGWQTLRNALPTRQKIAGIFPIQNSLCPLCDEEEESSFHLFWQCQYAKALWFGSLWGIRTEGTPCRDWNDWMIWFRDGANRPLNLCFVEFLLGALCTFDIIWKVRNKLIHNSIKLGMAEAIQQVCRLFQDHSTTSHATLRKERITIAPPEDWISCFTDIATASNHAFGAAVFRDCNNRLRAAITNRLHVTDPTLAEATMLVIAAEYAAKNNFHKVLFFCDNSPVVQYLNSSLSENNHQKLAGVTDRFRSNVHSIVSFKLCHIPRSQKFCAHNMAKWAKLQNVTGEIDLGSIEEGVFSNEEEWNPGAKGIG